MNLARYVFNNSPNLIDPSGLEGEYATPNAMNSEYNAFLQLKALTSVFTTGVTGGGGSWLDNYADWFNDTFGREWSTSIGEGYIQPAFAYFGANDSLANATDTQLTVATGVVSAVAAFAIVYYGPAVLSAAAPSAAGITFTHVAAVSTVAATVTTTVTLAVNAAVDRQIQPVEYYASTFIRTWLVTAVLRVIVQPPRPAPPNSTTPPPEPQLPAPPSPAATPAAPRPYHLPGSTQRLPPPDRPWYVPPGAGTDGTLGL
jgi:hypothetical protein